MSEFNRMQTLKRRIFAMRNGIIADTLRKAGSSYKMIFGLNLPQLIEIADEYGHNRELAEELWADKRTRESLLLAPMLFPPEEMDYATALQWARDAAEIETADILCHRLLRHLPYAWDIAVELTESPVDMHRYTAMRLMWNLISRHLRDILPYAESEAARNVPLTSRVSVTLVDEVKYMLEE